VGRGIQSFAFLFFRDTQTDGPVDDFVADQRDHSGQMTAVNTACVWIQSCEPIDVSTMYC